MSNEMMTWIIREALILSATVAAFPVVAAVAAGLLIGVAQAITQVQDQSVSLAARIIAVFGSLLAAGPWIFARISRFALNILEMAATT